MDPDKSLIPAAQQALMNRPTRLKQGSHEGNETLTADDIKMPRLVLAQSQHTDPENTAYQKGVVIGDLFNDLTGQVYAQPLDFTVVRADKPRWIEFNPREQGGGVKEMNIRPGDPRTEWRDGKKPVATQFYDYVIVMWPSREFIAVSYKSTGITASAKPLNGLRSSRDCDIWEGRYQMKSFADKNAKGSFRSAGIINHPTEPWLSDEEAAFAKRAFDALKSDKRATDAFERETKATTHEDTDESPVARAARESATADVGVDADVPF